MYEPFEMKSEFLLISKQIENILESGKKNKDSFVS